MKATPIYKLMSAFPDHFLPLFTYSGNLKPEEVIDALNIPSKEMLLPSDQTMVLFLNRFIQEADAEGNYHWLQSPFLYCVS